MCLVHQVRTVTKDVDGLFTEPTVVRAAARSVADVLSLPEDWLNDAADVDALTTPPTLTEAGLLDGWPPAGGRIRSGSTACRGRAEDHR
jgi:hypothetical protein